jgi:hypothetical protein
MQGRQLHLFKSKRQRGVLPPPPLEFESHCFVADMCKRWIKPHWKFTHIPNGEVREHRFDAKGRRYSPSGQRLQRMGLTPGWPDFIFVGPHCAVFWLELKRERRGRISEDQSDIAAHLMACGFGYLCTNDTREAIKTLVEVGILRGGVEVQ